MADRRRETGDARQEMGHRGDGRQKTGTGDEILETGQDTVDRTVVLETENRRQEMGRLTGDKTGDRTLVQETVDFVLRWDWEMGDRKQEILDRR